MKKLLKLAFFAITPFLLPISNLSKVHAATSYEDTSVINLKYSSGNLGFELSNSDYNGQSYGNNFDSLQRNQNYINAFENIKIYSTSLTDFQKNNPGGGSTYSSFGTNLFPNMWAPQLWLEMDNNGVWQPTRIISPGDIVYIPAGTTFPSCNYVKNPVGNLKVYKTTEDVSFVMSPSQTFEKCNYTLTTISDLSYFKYNSDSSYLSIKIKNSDYGNATKDISINNSKLDYFNFRKNIEINGQGTILLDSLIGGEHEYHYQCFVNKDNNESISIQARGLIENDIINFPKYSTFPSYSYLSGATNTPTGYVLEYSNIFSYKNNEFEKISSEPSYYENDLPVISKVDGVSAYTSSVTVYSSEQAALNNVPQGYEGSVAMQSGTNAGFTLGYGSLSEKIVFSRIISMKIRCYIESTEGDNDSYPEIRICKDAGKGDWIVRLSRTKFSKMTDNWIELDFSPTENTTFCDASKFLKLADGNGFLDTFEFGVRSNNSRKCYLDSVKLLLKEPDKDAPVISYNGPLSVTTRVGRAFNIDVSAYDYGETRNIDVVYEWFDGDTKLDSVPNEIGEYRLHLSASDSSGNTSTLDIAVLFNEADTTAPIINLKISTIHAKVGEKMQLNVKAFDEVDGEVEVEVSYPNNMFDDYLCLVEGNFEITFTATDLSNNTSVKKLNLIVTE